MTTELIKADESVPRRDDTFLVARNQMELQACQSRMLEWFQQQILLCKRNERELRDALDIAERNRWRRGTLTKQLKYSLDRKQFLVKCRKAVEAGYAIIPDMPCDVFAIRVRKGDGPSYECEDARYGVPRLDDQAHDNLPAGEGDYVSNRPEATPARKVTKTNDKGEQYEVNRVYTKAFKPLQFPVIAARTRLMEATEGALSLKIFDELAIAPPRKKKDPMILGRIHGPKKHRFDDSNVLNFIVCWFLDLKTLE